MTASTITAPTATAATATAPTGKAASTPESVEPGTAVRRRAAAFCFFGAAGLSLAGFLATNFEGKADESAYLHSLAAHPRQAVAAATLLHFGYLLFVPVAFVLARLARRGARKLSAAGIVLAVLGSGLSGLLVTDLYDLSIARHVGTSAGAAISNMSGVPLAGLGIVSMAFLTSLGMFVGLVLLAGAMRRARLAPIWPAIAILGGFASAFGAHDMLRSCIGFGVVFVAIAYLGVKVLRMSDERFAYGSDPR
jgi:hypothetical protein